MSAGNPIPNEMGAEDFRRALAKLVPRMAGLVTFSGGEPLLAPFCLDLAEWVRGEFGVPMNLITNATQIDCEAKAARIAASFQEVQVSIDGATPAVFERTRGPGSFEPMRNGLRLLAQQDIAELAVAICLLPWNLDDLFDNLVPFLEEVDPNRRITSVRVSDTIQFGRADGSMSVRLTAEQDARFSEMQHRIAATGRRNWTRADDDAREHHFRFNKGRSRQLKGSCGFGDGLILDSNGDLYPCPMMKRGARLTSVLAPEADALLGAQLRSAFQRHHVDQIVPCKSCEIRYLCRGGCRVENARASGSTEVVDCTPAHKAERVARVGDEIRQRYSSMVRHSLRVLQ